MNDKDKALAHYRMIIDQMQDGVFYAQDEDGVLRRWYPPRRPAFDQQSK